MRLNNLMIAAFALLAATPVTAQGVSPAVLAPGEILAQVAGTAQIQSKPEVARFRLSVSARADTAVAARAASDAALRDLIAKLKSRGVPDAAITILPPGVTQFGFVGNAAYPDDEALDPSAATAMMAMARQRKTASVGLQIELTDMNQLAVVRQLLLERDDVASQLPILSLRDDTAARRTAILQAIAKAREEAAAYAASLGLRVARIVRIFDPNSNAEQAAVWSQMIALMNGGTGNEVVTEARVGMDVILAPR